MSPNDRPSGAWMDVAEVTAWIAFRDPRSQNEWDAFVAGRLSRSWSHWGFRFGFLGMEDQVQQLLIILKLRSEGQAWRGPTDEFGGPWKRQLRALVRKLMRENETTAAALAAQLEQDIHVQTEINRALETADAELVSTIRAERLDAIGHKTINGQRPNPSAVAEKIDGTLLLGPRTISCDGWLQEDTTRDMDEWLGCKGPYFDRIHFRTKNVLALWPPYHEDESALIEQPSATENVSQDTTLTTDGTSGAHQHSQKNRGGRPAKWDWISFAGEMMRLANKPDGLPSRPELQKQMLDWCERAWGDSPAESSVRDLIARLYPE